MDMSPLKGLDKVLYATIAGTVLFSMFIGYLIGKFG